MITMTLSGIDLNNDFSNLEQLEDVENIQQSSSSSQSIETLGWGDVSQTLTSEVWNPTIVNVENSTYHIGEASEYEFNNGLEISTNASQGILILKYDENGTFVDNLMSDGWGSAYLLDVASNNHTISILFELKEASNGSCEVEYSNFSWSCISSSSGRKDLMIISIDSNLSIINWGFVEASDPYRNLEDQAKIEIDDNNNIYFAKASVKNWAKFYSKSQISSGSSSYTYLNTGGDCNNNADLITAKLSSTGAWSWQDSSDGPARIISLDDIEFIPGKGLHYLFTASQCTGDTDTSATFDSLTIYAGTYGKTVLGNISSSGVWQKITTSTDRYWNSGNSYLTEYNGEIILFGSTYNQQVTFLNYTGPNSQSANLGGDVVIMLLDWANNSVSSVVTLGNTSGDLQNLEVYDRYNMNCIAISFRATGNSFYVTSELFNYTYIGYNVACLDIDNGNFDWIANAEYDDDDSEFYVNNQGENVFFGNIKDLELPGFSIDADGHGIVQIGPDYDMNGYSDEFDLDDDGDGISDLNDFCSRGVIFSSNFQSDGDQDGCRDSDEDIDDDGDGKNDSSDQCATGTMYWVRNSTTDFDDDGCNDASEDFNDDNDNFQDFEDMCPRLVGNSTYTNEKGCPDDDGDGRANMTDPFPNDASEWKDTDGDGYGDNGDEYPLDATQNADTDSDGYGDNSNGNSGDACPSVAGNSTRDRLGCVDTDGDGFSDFGDAFYNNPTQYLDSDGDGYGNNQSTGATQADAFPSDGTQWVDADGDGHGDNKYGSQGDHFPNDATRWQDSDEDGYANTDDAFDNDATQWNDTDGDGYGDNQNGNNADIFPNDSSEWYDSDGDGVGDNSDNFKFDGSQSVDGDNDGYGDNRNGTNGDQFANDSLRWSDRDGDGYSDQQNDDAFINDASQWNDSDGDGYGDNANGNNPDAFVNDSSEWKDTDGDGFGNNGDWAPTDGTQWIDADNDGFG